MGRPSNKNRFPVCSHRHTNLTRLSTALRPKIKKRSRTVLPKSCIGLLRVTEAQVYKTVSYNKTPTHRSIHKVQALYFKKFITLMMPTNEIEKTKEMTYEMAPVRLEDFEVIEAQQENSKRFQAIANYNRTIGKFFRSLPATLSPVRASIDRFPALSLMGISQVQSSYELEGIWCDVWPSSSSNRPAHQTIPESTSQTSNAMDVSPNSGLPAQSESFCTGPVSLMNICESLQSPNEQECQSTPLPMDFERPEPTSLYEEVLGRTSLYDQMTRRPTYLSLFSTKSMCIDVS